MIQLKEWIEDGITIRKTNNGYQVFTIPTQHFDIKELDELTAELVLVQMVLKSGL